MPLVFSKQLPASVSSRVDRFSNKDDLDRFDEYSAKILSADSDIVTAWSGSARRTMTRAKNLGQITCLERGSTHIEVQRDLLLQEYERYGIQARSVPDQRTIESELAEYELASKIFVPSAFVWQSFLAKGIHEGRLALARYGVDTDLYRPLSSPPKRFVVSHIGGISARKGVHYLLQAMSELNLPDVELRLYGNVFPEMRPLLERHADMLGHVGPVSRKALVTALNDSSVMVLASIEEGLAMVLGEAMACGRPVICSTNTGGPDIIEDGVSGLIFPAGDVERLKSCLVRLYEDPELRLHMGENGRHAAEALTWDTYGDEVWAQYQALAG